MQLKRWKVSFETLFPGVDHDMPHAYNLVLTNAKSTSPTIDN